MRIPARKIPQHLIQIPKISQTMMEFTLVKQMGGTVDDHVLPGECKYPGFDFDQLLKKQTGIYVGPRSGRQNIVVHIKRCLAFSVRKWRNFMSPFSVVAIVIGTYLSGLPAAPDQGFLCRINTMMRHDNIDVGDEAAPPCGEFCECGEFCACVASDILDAVKATDASKVSFIPSPLAARRSPCDRKVPNSVRNYYSWLHPLLN